MHTIWSRMLLSFIYVRRWRLSCIVAVYCKYSFTMGSPWPFLSRIRYPLHEFVWGYIVNLASPPIINTTLKPAYQSNQPIVHVSLCHILWAIDAYTSIYTRVYLTLIWTLYDDLYVKKWTRLVHTSSLRVFARYPDSFLRRVCTRLSALIPPWSWLMIGASRQIST